MPAYSHMYLVFLTTCTLNLVIKKSNNERKVFEKIG